MHANSNGRSAARGLDLGHELRMARDAKRWTQMQLALEARVSTRTIVALENGKAGLPRPDVIVRLARALGADPKAWLSTSGQPADDNMIERSQRFAGGFCFYGEMDPADYFSRMVRELSEGDGRLMCVCYPSSPGTSHRPDVRNLLAKAVNSGLSVALVCPFAKPDPVESSIKPYLARYYRDVYEQVILLARDLRKGIDSNRKDHLAVFVPAEQVRGAHWEMPPQGVSKVRQALIKRYDTDEDVGGLELIAWVELNQDRKDRMIQIYPSERKDQARVDVLRCWREYFDDIIDSFDTKKGWQADNRRRTLDWKICLLPN